MNKKLYNFSIILGILLCISNNVHAQKTRIVENESIRNLPGLPTSFSNTTYLVINSLTLQNGFSVKASDGPFHARLYAKEGENTPPSSDQLFVRTEHINVEGITIEKDISYLEEGKAVWTDFNYFDEFGRIDQAVSVQATPAAKDFVQPYKYETDGQQKEQHFGYPAATSEGEFNVNGISSSSSYYSNTFGDTRAYSTGNTENWPNQSVTGPGDAWSTKLNQQTVNVYQTADIRKWKVIYDASNEVSSINTDSYYPERTILVKRTTNEEGHVVKEYIFALTGKTVLTEVEEDGGTWAQTHYVYDLAGKLQAIITPKLIAAYGTGSNISKTKVDDMCYVYSYDDKQRPYKSKVPGVIGYTEVLYDKWNRIAASRDATQSSIWNFIKYDAFNRPVMAGEFLWTNTVEALKIEIATAARYVTFTGATASNKTGYTGTAFPDFIDDDDVLSVTYYDNYNFANADWNSLAFNLPSGFNGARFNAVNGQTTGSMVKILDTSNWLRSVVYYDKEYRPLQMITQNHIGGVDKTSNEYNFIGQVLISQQDHNSSDYNNQVSVLAEYTYDDSGRLLENWQTIDNGQPILVAEYKYNELGQLIEKNLHSEDGGNSFLQSVDYSYNIRGMLTHINNSSLTNDGTYNNDTNDLFGMEFGYTDAATVGPQNVSARFDSRLAYVKWKTDNKHDAPTEKIFGYNYDEAGRLKDAYYAAKNGASWNAQVGNNDVNITYADKNGNISSIKRQENVAGTKTEIDNLQYTYDGDKDQLKYVEDTSLDPFGFNDAYTATPLEDYDYNDAGGLTVDYNKAITGTAYNSLNLPELITITDVGTISYLYDAAGILLKKTIALDDGTTLITDYLPGLIYENQTVAYVQMPEGRALPTGSGYDYEYFLTDHQGNTRVSFGNLQEIEVFTATMESEPEILADEIQQGFLELNGNRGSVNHTKSTVDIPDPNESRLVIKNDVGPAMTISVKQGDVVEAEVYALYTINDGGSNGIGGLAGILENNVFNIAGEAVAAPFSIAVTSFAGAFTNSGPNVPEAYLNMIWVSDNNVDTQIRYDPISATGVSEFEKLNTSFTAPANGTLFIYVANETTTTGQEVYFDDFKIIHRKNSKALQVTGSADYYPFGMPIASSQYIDEARLKNRYGYQGVYAEYEKLTGLNEFALRQYDAALGRWNSTDPYNEFSSPYVGMGNIPQLVTDPDGGCISCIIWAAKLIASQGIWLSNVVITAPAIISAGTILTSAAVVGGATFIGTGIAANAGVELSTMNYSGLIGGDPRLYSPNLSSIPTQNISFAEGYQTTNPSTINGSEIRGVEQNGAVDLSGNAQQVFDELIEMATFLHSFPSGATKNGSGNFYSLSEVIKNVPQNATKSSGPMGTIVHKKYYKNSKPWFSWAIADGSFQQTAHFKKNYIREVGQNTEGSVSSIHLRGMKNNKGSTDKIFTIRIYGKENYVPAGKKIFGSHWMGGN